MISSLFKHLPGRHEQQAHAGKEFGKLVYDSAYLDHKYGPKHAKEVLRERQVDLEKKTAVKWEWASISGKLRFYPTWDGTEQQEDVELQDRILEHLTNKGYQGFVAIAGVLSVELKPCIAVCRYLTGIGRLKVTSGRVGGGAFVSRVDGN